MQKNAGYWLIVASRDHVLAGKIENIAQASHGSREPLEKMHVGDWITYYSPRELYGDTKPCRKFVAIARVTGERVFQASFSETFKPYRRQVEYLEDVHEADIRPLISELTFIKNKTQWGMVFRSGFLAISREDFMLICNAMKKYPAYPFS